MSPYSLTLDSATVSTLPLREEVLEASGTFIESVQNWKKGKVVKGVHVYYEKDEKHPSGPAWHARISRHPSSEIGFDRLWETLGPPDHFTNESKYISSLKYAEHLLTTKLGEVWALHYSFSRPVSPRVFVELQLYRFMDATPENNHQRSALIVTLPFDVGDDEALKAKRGNRVIGKYVSVERIAEIEGGRTVEWRMATCSTPGGSIPQCVSEFTIPGKIAKDVPHLIHWLKQNTQDGARA